MKKRKTCDVSRTMNIFILFILHPCSTCFGKREKGFFEEKRRERS
jgi:hypothetical protein